MVQLLVVVVCTVAAFVLYVIQPSDIVGGFTVEVLLALALVPITTVITQGAVRLFRASPASTTHVPTPSVPSEATTSRRGQVVTVAPRGWFPFLLAVLLGLAVLGTVASSIATGELPFGQFVQWPTTLIAPQVAGIASAVTMLLPPLSAIYVGRLAFVLSAGTESFLLFALLGFLIVGAACLLPVWT